MDSKAIDNLGYLLHHLAIVLDHQSDVLLQERLDISYSQFKILMALKWRSNVQQKQIAQKLGQTEASVSRQIKGLAEAGLLRITRSNNDRREHITVLTPKGEALVNKAMKALNDYHAPVFARLSFAQQLALQTMLETMHDASCSPDRPGGCK